VLRSMLISYLNPTSAGFMKGAASNPRGRVALLSRILPRATTPRSGFPGEPRELVNVRRAAGACGTQAIKNRRGDLRRGAGS